MKQTVLFLITLLISTITSAQPSVIKLSKPEMNRGNGIMQALADRKSTSEYSDEMLTSEDLSNLLWAANGINRPENSKKTAGSAMNRQDVSIYTFTEDGVFLYDSAEHALVPVTEGDHRKLFGERGMSPLIVLLVTDIGKFGDVGTLELRKEWGAIDVGLVSQNMALFCSANGIGTKPRAGMNRNGIKELLGLTELQLPILNHSVGYIKD